MGGLKLDFLTIQSLDKVHQAMDLLIKDGLMEWQGTIKKTYDKYLHPNVLDYDNQDMWKMVGQNDVVDLFQFDSDVGLAASQKVKPTNLKELAVSNSLMRLASDGEQPVDRYVRFKADISLWYEDMEKYDLNKEEIKTLEKHLLGIYGVADTQEVVMELSMDEKIANFDILQSNQLRKCIARKVARDIDKMKKLYYERGTENGNRVELLNYVWERQITPQLG